LQLFSQLATRTITNKMANELSERKMSSDWPILTKLRCKLLKGCYTQATCLATLRKVVGHSTFLATRNATIAKWGVTREFFLATCNATFVALQVVRKIASCNMALSQSRPQSPSLYQRHVLLLYSAPRPELLLPREKKNVISSLKSEMRSSVQFGI